MKVTIKGYDTLVTGTLITSKTAFDFGALLPLTLTLEDYAGTEKIAYLPKKLTIEGAPEGYDPSPGDIAYYAPWGNLAVFYRDFGYSSGLILLGKIETGLEVFQSPGSVSVKIELAE